MTSDVFKVRYENAFAVLKILNDKGMKFETKGAIVLRHFGGHGAVHLLKSDDGAHLLEFVDGPQLKTLVESGKDDRATEVIAEVVSRLHSAAESIPPGLIGMERNFLSLFQKVKTEPRDSIYAEAAKQVEHLIATEQDVRVLHGDIHHENILSSSSRGWLAIDPQCLAGERSYDLANTFYNPMGFESLAETEAVIQHRSSVLSQRLKIDQRRILQYAFAYGCLSACWRLEDGQESDSTLRIAQSLRQSLKRWA